MAAKKRPALLSRPSNFCPGCGHGIVVRLLAELIEEKGVQSREVQAVGCACNLNGCWGGLKLQCPHGRAAAAAIGVKAGAPDDFVFTYQGDGDAYVIGLSETLNAGYRGASITAVIINNNNFGMTGGQMSWTTLPGQITTTCVNGRNIMKTGEPFHGPEMLAAFQNVSYAARCAVFNPAEVNRTKACLRRAMEIQMGGEYSIVEVLCACPTNWKMSPIEANRWVEKNVRDYYALGVIKDAKEAVK
jgi:2-oxoglutarate ferredoxin oxidoreductase subunit beta